LIRYDARPSWFVTFAVHPSALQLDGWRPFWIVHDLYRNVGFSLLSKPERYMEVFTADIHKLRKFE